MSIATPADSTAQLDSARERVEAAQLLTSRGVRVNQVYLVYAAPDGADVVSEIHYSTPEGGAETAEVRTDGDIVTRPGW
jgi:hypothetical protein